MSKTNMPFDYTSQKWIGIGDKFPKKIHNATTTSDGLMSAEDKSKLDSIDAGEVRVYDVASQTSNGLLSKEDKKKLDDIEEGANNYTHPDNENIRHVTDAQITNWNSKASTDTVTQTTKGLMSASDKILLDEVRVKLPYLATTSNATQNRDGLMSVIDKKKLDSIEEGANNYVHPNNEGTRHVSDAEKAYWNAKANKTIVTNTENGLMASVDKIKLDSIEAGANKYIHPEGPEYRHVTDEQIKYWNSKSVIDNATEEQDGLMSKEDKKKLNQITIPKTTEVVLSLSKWSDSEPYTQTLSVPGIEPDSMAYIGINSSATIEQMTCAAEAKLKVKEVRKDEIEIIANGIKPDMNLPVIIMIGSNIIVLEVKQYANQEYMESSPTTGIHYQNEIVYSSKPVQTKCIGWVCVEEGEPGIWKPFGEINI